MSEKSQRNRRKLPSVEGAIGKVRTAPQATAQRAESTGEATASQPLTPLAREVATFFKERAMKAKQRSKLRMASKAKNKRRFALPAIPAVPRSSQKWATEQSARKRSRGTGD